MKILLVTHILNGIPQKLFETESLDIPDITSRLRLAGCDVEVLTHGALLSLNPYEIKGSIIWYASSQYPEFYNYIEDCLLYAELCGGYLVPSFPLFRSHENKFFQELFRKKIGLDFPRSNLIGSMEELKEIIPELHFPLILKTSSGFGSQGVSKVHSAEELVSATRRILTHIHPQASNPLRRLKNKRSYKKMISSYKNNYPLRVGRVILQEYLDGLTHDWKILVFGESCFCLKRYVRSNDFRASGSGDFSFDATPSDLLLDYALDIVHRLDTPWASLDIAEFNDAFGLIEYQCMHFGLYTLMRNYRCYEKVSSGWVEYRVEDPSPEQYFCDALLKYYNKT